MIRFSARAVLGAFVLLVFLVPLAIVLAPRVRPTYEAFVWLEIAPPVTLVDDVKTTSREDYLADQIQLLGSDLVLEPAWNRVAAAERFAVDPDNLFETLRKRVYLGREGPSWFRLSVRGTQAEMPACKSFTRALADSYLSLQAEREDLRRTNMRRVLSQLREQQSTKVSELMLRIESVRFEESELKKGGTAATLSKLSKMKADLAVLQVTLDGTLDTIQQLDRRLWRINTDSELPHVTQLGAVRVQKMESQWDNARPLMQWLQAAR